MFLLFLIPHMGGNVLFLFGPDLFNSYAHHLHQLVPIVIGIELVMLISITVHMVMGIRVAIANRKAASKRHSQKSLSSGRIILVWSIGWSRATDAIKQSELLNQKESSPMIGFGLDYINVAERPNMDFSDNGKDIVMPMVSVSIPIFNKKYKSQTKQNDLQQQEITAQKQERLNALETLLDKANNERISARISYATQTKNLKQAKDAEDILIKSYETGTIDFNDVLDIQELQLKFQMNQIESIRTYYVQSTIINYLTQQ